MLAMPADDAARIHDAAPHFYEHVGFDCGPGWAKLLEMVGRAIEKQDANTQAMQVKEKFGTLRIYTSGSLPAVFIVIDAAENMSATICEGCGEAGTLRTDGWLRTLCDACEEKRSA